jgi:hypothetical protein
MDRCTQGGGGGGGGTSCTPYNFSWKTSTLKCNKTHTPPWFSHNPKYPPQKNLPKKTNDPPWISNYCASMALLLKSTEEQNSEKNTISILKIERLSVSSMV